MRRYVFQDVEVLTHKNSVYKSSFTIHKIISFSPYFLILLVINFRKLASSIARAGAAHVTCLGVSRFHPFENLQESQQRKFKLEPLLASQCDKHRKVTIVSSNYIMLILCQALFWYSHFRNKKILEIRKRRYSEFQ